MTEAKNGPRTKGRTGTELALALDQMIDGLIDKTVAPDLAGTVAQSANVKLRIALGYIEHARARGEKPNVPFFAA